MKSIGVRCHRRRHREASAANSSRGTLVSIVGPIRGGPLTAWRSTCSRVRSRPTGP
jgi:hypothetical protein